MVAESTTIYLKVARVQPIPDSLEDHDVPIFLTNEDSIVQSEWDLTTQQVSFCVSNFIKKKNDVFCYLKKKIVCYETKKVFAERGEIKKYNII